MDLANQFIYPPMPTRFGAPDSELQGHTLILIQFGHNIDQRIHRVGRFYLTIGLNRKYKTALGSDRAGQNLALRMENIIILYLLYRGLRIISMDLLLHVTAQMLGGNHIKSYLFLISHYFQGKMVIPAPKPGFKTSLGPQTGNGGKNGLGLGYILLDLFGVRFSFVLFILFLGQTNQKNILMVEFILYNYTPGQFNKHDQKDDPRY